MTAVGLAAGCAACAACAACVALAACGGAESVASGTHAAGSAHVWRPVDDRGGGLRAADDPTVAPAHLVPLTLDEAQRWGSEPGGGVRATVAGVRVVVSPPGDVLAADERLPGAPSSAVELPGRLGGGFLFVHGTHLWRAEAWLGPLAPLFTLTAPIAEVLVGLDRVYLRSTQVQGGGLLAALDPRTGESLDLGPLPSSPRVGRIAALDGWRALALADLRGTLVTADAGASWRAVSLPIEPTQVVAVEDGFAVGGFDRNRQMQWWSVSAEGQAGWLATPSVAGVSPAAPAPAPARVARGPRPLIAALEDGWPLVDGTALVARDGALMRVRLADGGITESDPDAFDLRPSRCHPLSLASPASRGAFAFVCGQPQGPTVVYAWRNSVSPVPAWPGQPALRELRRFDTPREVLASGSGGLAVRGPCAAKASERTTRTRQDWCLMRPSRAQTEPAEPAGAAGAGPWSELRLEGDDVDRARVVVLSDGRAAFVRPPVGADLSTARLALMNGAKGQNGGSSALATHVPLAFPPLPADVTRALRMGTWMDGFEERRPGVLGGWVDAAGSVLGIEIALDGTVRVGESIRDAAPVVSGRWALGWTASRRGFETTDGGMTWAKDVDLPEPIATGSQRETDTVPDATRERVCGPIGCILAGWLRVGWGAALHPPAEDPPPPRPRSLRHPPATLRFDCERLPSPALPATPDRPFGPALAHPSPSRANPIATRVSGLRRRARGSTGGLSVSGAVTEFRGFAGGGAPAIPDGDLGLSAEATHALDRSYRSAPLGRVYAWGPGEGDWDPLGRWQVRWEWPWGATSGGTPFARSSLRASAIGPSPWPTLEAAGRSMGLGLGLAGTPDWVLVTADDPDHALLVERRVFASGVAVVQSLATLETSQVPVEVKREDGEPLPDIQAAARSEGVWTLATAQARGEAPATLLWRIDAGIAHPFGQVPRLGADAPGVRLARRVDTRALALVVPGADLARGATLWLAALPTAQTLPGDVESLDPRGAASDARGAVGEPELLAPADLSDRPIHICTGDDAGWELEMGYPGAVELRVGAEGRDVGVVRLASVGAWFRVSRDGACVVRVVGAADLSVTRHSPDARAASARVPGTSGTRDGTHPARTIEVGVLDGGTRVPLRCSQTNPAPPTPEPPPTR